MKSGQTLDFMSPRAGNETPPNLKDENDSFLSRMEKPMLRNDSHSNHDASS